MDIIHKKVDAPIQFSSLLFIPQKANEFFWMDRENYGLDLYVKRVLIQHKNKELLPEYLSFVKGVVDSEDLPLNISRETLQENVVFTKIASSVTNQVLSHLKEKAEKNPEEYLKFWNEHGKIFKLGYSDFPNQEKYMELIRFNSSHNKDKNELTSLAEYVDRKKDDQKEIYYISGSSREAIESDPHIEIFQNKGLEVLYLYDPVDEFVISSLGKYKDYEFKSVDTVKTEEMDKFKDVEENKPKVEELNKDDEKHFSSLLSKMKEILGDKVEVVKESKRLTGSPSVLINADDGMSASMQKMLRMANKEIGASKKIMEVNKNHKLIRNMLEIFKKDSTDKFIANATEQMYESALLMEGVLEDPHALVKRINELLENSSDWYNEVNNK
jgi:molecular chaperone HtpG